MKARSKQATSRGPSVARSRAELAGRLRERRGEIEEVVLTRVYAISDPGEVSEATYADGLRAAVAAAIECGLAGVRRDAERPPKIPVVLLAQARLAARSGVSLDTVLRRYFAGYVLLGDFLIEESERSDSFGRPEFQRLLRTQATHFDRLIAAISEEHGREAKAVPESSEQRRVQLVQRLLAGEQLDGSALTYSFDDWHLALIATGTPVVTAMRKLLDSLDCRRLSILHDATTIWVWVGTRQRTDPAELLAHAESVRMPGLALAIGEPGEGLAGWRLSHRQAAAALPVALRGSDSFIRYADVGLLAAVLQDDLLAASLRRLYVEPLSQESNGGETLLTTLRAYFVAGRNVSSAASALEVNRHTVASRIRVIEEKIERPIYACGIELEAALRLAELESSD